MPHRAEQIIDAMATEIDGSATFQGPVYKHRAFSLPDFADEFPAVSVDIGADDQLDDDGADNLAYLDSLLTVETTIYARDTGDDPESLVRSSLMDVRRSIHVALMADRAHGLSFVINTRYGGADRAEISADGDHVVGRLVCRWLVHYRMNVADPA